MGFNPTKEQESNFNGFVKELTELSKKYKITIHSTGGVHIYSPDEDISDVVYSNDSTSGDLEFHFLNS